MPKDMPFTPFTPVWRAKTQPWPPHAASAGLDPCTALRAFRLNRTWKVFPFHWLLCPKSLLFTAFVCVTVLVVSGENTKYTLSKRRKRIETCTTVHSIQKNWITTANIEVIECFLTYFKGLVGNHSSTHSNITKLCKCQPLVGSQQTRITWKYKDPYGWTRVGQFTARSFPRTWEKVPSLFGGGFRQSAQSSSKFTRAKKFCFFIHRYAPQRKSNCYSF